MGSHKNTDMSATENTVKVVEAVDQEGTPIASATEETIVAETKATKVKKTHGRSKKYQAVRAQVDKTREYDAFSAIELVKKLSYTKFGGTIEAHALLREEGASFQITFPHSTGKTLTVAVATDELLSEIAEGKVNFDVLLATPAYMPKLAKLARILGPKGLMPNPKNGTLTNDPETKKKALEAGTITLKGEKKAPLVHVVLGNTKSETKDLVENLQMLIKVMTGKLLKLTVSATMSPGIKVNVKEIKEA